MKTVEILGANRFETFSKTRDGARAIIVQDGNILLTHELNSGWWLLPGGGQEEGETFEECVIREVEEETGVLVRVIRPVVFMKEYYEEYCYFGCCFACEVTGKGHMNLTEAEIRRGVQPEWIPLQDALELFSKHESYADISEELMTIAKEFFDAINGRSTFLSRESALEMIRPTENFSQVGLGLFLSEGDILLSQGWGENGQSMLKLNTVTGEISVVMTNKDPGVDQTESGLEHLATL